MNPRKQEAWRDQVVSEILEAIAKDDELRDALIFKGARILNIHLGAARQSLDIDSNLNVNFQKNIPDHQEQSEWFASRLEIALHRHFEGQEPVRYQLESVKVAKDPGRSHPRGWDMLKAHIRIIDGRMTGVRSLPKLELEIASPESLGEGAVCELRVDGASVLAYSLERIAGEKLRAFLTSLPAYRQKVGGGERSVRAKDLYDLARILDSRALDDEIFWKMAAAEFQLACASRFVDCDGPATFKENREATRTTYEGDATLAQISWEKAERALDEITSLFQTWKIFPLEFPLPEEI